MVSVLGIGSGRATLAGAGCAVAVAVAAGVALVVSSVTGAFVGGADALGDGESAPPASAEADGSVCSPSSSCVSGSVCSAGSPEGDTVLAGTGRLAAAGASRTSVAASLVADTSASFSAPRFTIVTYSGTASPCRYRPVGSSGGARCALRIWISPRFAPSPSAMDGLVTVADSSPEAHPDASGSVAIRAAARRRRLTGTVTP